LDLFNHGYYWEAHEVWESLWHACGRSGQTADFLKGLIKLAAAGVKHREGVPKGVKSHAGRAMELFRGIAREQTPEGGLYLGLPLQELTELAEAVCQAGWPVTPPLLLPTFHGADTGAGPHEDNRSGTG
jgi:predicted metal-dependent hydrolase